MVEEKENLLTLLTTVIGFKPLLFIYFFFLKELKWSFLWLGLEHYKNRDFIPKHDGCERFN